MVRGLLAPMCSGICSAQNRHKQRQAAYGQKQIPCDWLARGMSSFRLCRARRISGAGLCQEPKTEAPHSSEHSQAGRVQHLFALSQGNMTFLLMLFNSSAATKLIPSSHQGRKPWKSILGFAGVRHRPKRIKELPSRIELAQIGTVTRYLWIPVCNLRCASA